MYDDLPTDARSLRGWEDIGTLAPTSKPPFDHVPEDACEGVPRNTLLSYCPANACPRNGACVAYDQDDSLARFTGCDYGLASSPSYCTRADGFAQTCEFQCFAAYEPQPQFKFFIPFSSALGNTVPRQSSSGDQLGLKTTEIPFLSNSFITKIGALNLTSAVSEVMISGGRSDKGSSQRVDATISTNLLSKARSVTSLSLLNIDLSKNDVAGILASASASLKTLDLRNTNLKTLPEAVFKHTQQLETLKLSQNGLSDVAIELPQLATLDLSGNVVASVTIKAPNLKTLDLSGNRLVSIPTGVFALAGLRTLKLKTNSIVFPLVLSQPQARFLGSVSSVDFDAVTQRTLDSALLVKGTTDVKGVPVILVSEQTASEYNDQLEQGNGSGSIFNSTASTSSSSYGSTGGSAGGSRDATSSTNAGSQGTSPGDYHSSASGAMGLDLGVTPGKSVTPPANGDTDAIANGSGVPLATKLLLGGIGSMFLAVMLVLISIRKRRHRTKSEPATYNPMTMTEYSDGSVRADNTHNGSSHIVSWWRDDDLLSHRLKASDITDERVISSDGSTVTWLVTYRGTRKLVSKRLIHGEGSVYEGKVVQLFTEAKIASSLTYPSILPLVGVAWTDKTDLQVLYEYMSNGNLSSLLSRSDPSTLPWMPEKLQLAIDIIEALVYTHSFNPPLLHRDLKSRNVLLDDDFKAKLADFGCARFESDNDTMTTSEAGTGRWLAPEILSGSTSYGSSSDIYSFGVVLCELDTHRVPFADEVATEGEMALLQRVARGELRPSVSTSCPPAIRELAEACLAFDPEKRPNAMQISHLLRSMRPRETERSGFI